MQQPSYLRHKVSKDAAEAYRRSSRAKPQAAVPVPEPAEVVKIAAVPKPGKKTRAAYYARVSSLLESQEQSIESQKAHFEKYIRSDPDLVFSGAYVDWGLTGTKAEVRPELQRLLRDCEDHRIDLICTKSISRFARNTTELLEIVRRLSSLGVTVWFEENEIRTDTMTSELMLTLLAGIAEQESHSISGNMKWGMRKRFQDGTFRHSLVPYGYGKDEDGNFVIVEGQAEVVRRIFRMVLSGNGMAAIAKALNKDRVPGPNGGKWSQGTLRSMVLNPAYKGDVLYQKSFTDEQFVQRKNTGELDQYYIAGHHDYIIDPADFDNAQEAVKQRAKEAGYGDGPRELKSYCFTGILTCKACGSVMHRQVWNGERPCWICHRHSHHPGLCSMKPQSDADLKRAFVNCLNKLAWSQKQADPASRILDVYERLLGKTEAERNAERLEEIDRLLEQNRREARLLNATIMRERFLPKHREKKAFLTSQEKELMAEKNAILIAGVPKGTLQGLKGFVNGWKITDDESAFPEDVFREYVTGCTVNTGKMVEFTFKCGLKLTESLYRAELDEPGKEEA